MPLAMLMFVTPMGPLDDVFARADKWASEHPGYSVKGEFSAEGSKDKVPFELEIQKPDSIGFRYVFKDDDYRMVKTLEGSVETAAAEKTFDERNGFPGMRTYPSDISGLQGVIFPGWLFVPNTKALFPGQPAAKRETVDGQTLDFVHTLYKGNGEEYEGWGWFRADGSLFRLRRRIVTAQGGSDFTWSFRPFGSAPKLSTFKLEIPNDYTPYRLPDSSITPEIGSPIRIGKWMRGGKEIDLDAEAKGTSLLAFLSPGTAPSRRMEETLSELEKGGVKVIRISDAPGDSSMVVAAKEGQIESLDVPATPFLMLLKEGKIAGLWLGSGNDGKETVKDVQNALAE